MSRPVNKPDCYKCKYRSKLLGNAHSECNYPGLENDVSEIRTKLNIKGNLHGIRSGWFMWPVNFDPVWLENCDGFKKAKRK